MTLINRLWDYDRDIIAFLGWYRFFRQRASHLCPEYPYITKLGKENRRSRAPGRLPAGGTSVPSLPWASGVFNWDSRASDARLVARGGGAEARRRGSPWPLQMLASRAYLGASPPVGMEPEVGEGSIGELGALALSLAAAIYLPGARRGLGKICVGLCVTLLPSWRNPSKAHAHQKQALADRIIDSGRSIYKLKSQKENKNQELHADLSSALGVLTWHWVVCKSFYCRNLFLYIIIESQTRSSKSFCL